MSSASALVGFTGLVGAALRRQRPFDRLYNSKNADAMRGGRYGHVVFSAARAEKWRANADPLADAAHIDELVDLLESFSAERLTLISTVDVYGSPEAVDETTAIRTQGLHPYGANRLRLEQAVAALPMETLVVRLPALFGEGLKKNVVYDLLHGNQVERIQPASSFQYYDLARLGDDLETLRDARVPLANLVTEPVSTAALVEQAFERPPLPTRVEPVPVHYDVRTRHSALFGATEPYIEPGASVLARLRRFVRSEAVR